MKKLIAKIVSILAHPMFIMMYVLTYLIIANRYIFGFSGDKAMGLVIISVLTISLMFPLLAIFMMKALGLIQSLEMEDKRERIGPLIVTGLFYMWLYVNVRNNDNIPGALSFFILGCTISVFLALIINSFTKVSLHTIATGGWVTGMIFIVFDNSYGYLDIPFPFLDMQWRFSDRLIIIGLILLAGLVGSARLYLKAHKEEEVYGGYIVGILAQMLAYRIFF